MLVPTNNERRTMERIVLCAIMLLMRFTAVQCSAAKVPEYIESKF